MTNDSAYKLRMEMIQLAQQRASEKFHMEWSKAQSNADRKGVQLNEVPDYPTTELLLEEARKIKQFVDKG